MIIILNLRKTINWCIKTHNDTMLREVILQARRDGYLERDIDDCMNAALQQMHRK
jgi:hypothetical protein